MGKNGDKPRICEVCGKTQLHSHSDSDIQEWQEALALDRSVRNHPAGRRLRPT
jgi:hypothetical protein